MGDDKGKKLIYGLLGCNISYSLSPLMHNAAFRYFGINAEYSIFDIAPKELSGFLSGIADGKISGINVTVPYKVAVMETLSGSGKNRIEKFAEKVGAVNTIRHSAGCLEGFNTDGPGFAESLKDDLGISGEDLTGEKVFIIGAGGAGRAVSFYLMSASPKPGRIFIYDTDGEKAKALSKDLIFNFGNNCAERVDADEASIRARECSLLVNATPIGTKEGDPVPFPGKYDKIDASLYDLVYARETEFVKAWKTRGKRASGGLGMLVNQAVLAFNIWTEAKYDLLEIKSVMRSSLAAEIREKYGWNIS